MRTVRVTNATKEVVLAERVSVADSFVRRAWGLLGRSSLLPDEGVIITRTNCVHSAFMRFPFDAIYVDRRGAVRHTVENFKPFRFGPLVRHSKHVIELSAGIISRTGTGIGDVIVFDPEIASE